MTKDDIFRLAGQVLWKLDSGATILAVERLPDKPFGWSIIIDGDGGPPLIVTVEHASAEEIEAVRDKLRERLAGLA